MNVRSITCGAVVIFLAFLLPVLSHGFWAVAETIQNGSQMVGKTQVILWGHDDLAEPLFRLPWSLWAYFVVMLATGLALLVKGFRSRERSDS